MLQPRERNDKEAWIFIAFKRGGFFLFYFILFYTMQ